MQDIFIGRQPIYNENLGVWAYELLFRSQDYSIEDIGENAATAQVVINTFFEIGVEKLVDSRRVAINASKQLLQEVGTLPILPTKVILEIPPTIDVSLQLFDSLKKLSAMGFTIALDDCVEKSQLQPLVPLANIIKVNVRHIKGYMGESYLRKLKKLKKPLLALKVESLAEYETYRDLGFSYFQGYFLSRPRTFKAAKLNESKLAVINLIRAIYDRDTENPEIIRLISADITLSYKLLKLINSPLFGLRTKIDSIKQAVVLLGRKILRTWVSMLALSTIDDQPAEITMIAMTRAKMCELLAEKAGLNSKESFFTVGIFSALNLLMDAPLDRIVESLPLSDAVRRALLDKKGRMGEALYCTLAYEHSNWKHISFQGLSTRQVIESYLQAIEWANRVMVTM
jgi:EAL and modified HD-GYP domain-containing signal transduction protein